MEKNILSLFVTNEITGVLIKKPYLFTLALLVMTSIYCILELFEWYRVLSKASVSIKNNPHYFYLYKIQPIISVIVMAASVIGYILNYQGYGYILEAIKSNEPVQLNKGLKNFYVAYCLLLISFVLAITSISYRLLW